MQIYQTRTNMEIKILQLKSESPLIDWLYRHEQPIILNNLLLTDGL